jgi:hypothetical protein
MTATISGAGIRASREPKGAKTGRNPPRLLFLGGRGERQIQVHDKAQECGNAADDRYQLQEDEGEQRAQTYGRFFPTIPHEAAP